jgi:Fur family ferric uptake transcriptional regulator
MLNGNDQSQATALPARRERDHTTDRLTQRLRAVGQRVTAQRLVILGALQPNEHISADEVLSRVERRLPAVNRSTVYRALELFRDLGLVSETDLGGGVRQFELIDAQRHHHLICHGCGAIDAFDDAMLTPLRDALQERHGFRPAIDHLAVFGWCAACAAERTPASAECDQGADR